MVRTWVVVVALVMLTGCRRDLGDPVPGPNPSQCIGYSEETPTASGKGGVVARCPQILCEGGGKCEFSASKGACVCVTQDPTTNARIETVPKRCHMQFSKQATVAPSIGMPPTWDKAECVGACGKGTCKKVEIANEVSDTGVVTKIFECHCK